MSEMGQTQKSGRTTGRSALPQGTDIAGPATQVRKVPTTEVAFSLDHPVGEREKRRSDCEVKRRSLGVLTGSLRGWSAGSSAS
jgi:hypothetical protein